jgi:tripartite-type tricarboxylate transporter receptor subunit TctC
VPGYSGGGDINLAVQRRELDGRGSDSWASMKSTHADWLRDRKINILFRVGPRREPDLPDVPLWSELGESEGQRQILDILSGDVAVGRPILTAPDVPADRLRALRKAFDETLADPEFIAAANQANVYINPMGGEELQAMVEKIAGPLESVRTMLRRAIEFKGEEKTRP